MDPRTVVDYLNRDLLIVNRRSPDRHLGFAGIILHRLNRVGYQIDEDFLKLYWINKNLLKMILKNAFDRYSPLVWILLNETNSS